jgi:hypothetical protein
LGTCWPPVIYTQPTAQKRDVIAKSESAAVEAIVLTEGRQVFEEPSQASENDSPFRQDFRGYPPRLSFLVHLDLQPVPDLAHQGQRPIVVRVDIDPGQVRAKLLVSIRFSVQHEARLPSPVEWTKLPGAQKQPYASDELQVGLGWLRLNATKNR